MDISQLISIESEPANLFGTAATLLTLTQKTPTGKKLITKIIPRADLTKGNFLAHAIPTDLSDVLI
jgi:hypothetical protein